MLDELLAAGRSRGRAPVHLGSDGWIALHPADSAPLTVAASRDRFHRPHRVILNTCPGRRYFFRQLAQGTSARHCSSRTLGADLGGWVTGDTFAPVRALLAQKCS